MFWSQVLDELGRGTSTHDGVAVAHATLDYVVSTLKPMCLFVTHYPDVARDITRKHPTHCDVKYPSYVEIDGESDGDDRRIEFLFKLAPGIAHRSYCLNVARMAGLPSDVIARAGECAREMEEAVAARAVMRDIERLGPEAATERAQKMVDLADEVAAVIDAALAAATPEEGAAMIEEAQAKVLAVMNDTNE